MSSNSGYLPRQDGELATWFTNFAEVCTANATLLGLSTGAVADITAAKDAFVDALTDHEAKVLVAQQSTLDKNAAREASIDAIRVFVKRLQITPSVDDGWRRRLGINVPKPRAPRTPQWISTLAAKISPDGNSVSLSWPDDGNGYPTNFFVQKQIGSGDWTTVAVTTRRRYRVAIDSAQTIQLRVYAQIDGASGSPSMPISVFAGLVTYPAPLAVAA